MSIASCRQSAIVCVDERMVGDLAVAGDDVLAAGELVGEDRGEEILGLHALDLRRDLASATEARSASATVAFQRQRAANIGASSSAWTSSGRTVFDAEIARHFLERKAVAGGEREDDRVLGRRRLQLEVELAAEPFAEREPPRAVDAAPERRVDDELHAACFIEEAFEHDRVERRQRAKRGARGGEVIDELLGTASARPISRTSTAFAASRPRSSRAASIRLAQPRYRLRQLGAPPRRLAEPERDAGRRALRVLDADGAALDAEDPVRSVAELEYVAGEALDREVFVHRPDRLALRLEDHGVVGGIGDRAAGGHRGRALRRAGRAARRSPRRDGYARSAGRGGC